MPLPAALIPFIAPTIAAGASIGATSLNASAARRQQERQMQQDIRFWHMNNEYNSPQAQMKRLQEAGLNPNLVYGQSSGGAAGQSQIIKTPDIDPAGNRRVEPELPMNMLSQYYDTQIKQAQTDNLKAQTQVAQENALLTASRAYGEGLRNSKTAIEAAQAQELYQNSVDMAKEQLRKLKADTAYTTNQDARQNITAALSNKLTAAQIQNVLADNELKELDKKLAAMGIRPSDPFYARAAVQIAEGIARKLGYIK